MPSSHYQHTQNRPMPSAKPVSPAAKPGGKATVHARTVMEHKNFNKPDETREFPNGRAEIVKISGGEVGRYVFSPGWRWSRDLKPIAKTESCETEHFMYHISGTIAIRMDDGTEFLAGPGDISALPSGHDAWVVGNEPAVLVDFQGATDYARHK